jgi:hypothetical protein
MIEEKEAVNMFYVGRAQPLFYFCGSHSLGMADMNYLGGITMLHKLQLQNASYCQQYSSTFLANQ